MGGATSTSGQRGQRDVATYPRGHTEVPTTKKDPAQNANNATAEKQDIDGRLHPSRMNNDTPQHRWVSQKMPKA